MKKILLFARDPGGANTIFPLVKPLRKKGYKVFIYGKDFALKKFKENHIVALSLENSIREINIKNIENFLYKLSPDLIITGTSADDMTEKCIWLASKKLNIPSFAILDQWMNYGIRFSRFGVNEIKKYLIDKNHEYLPTKILVMDKIAKEHMIQDGIPEEIILVSGQPYFEYIHDKTYSQNKLNLLKQKLDIKKDDYVVVFASEPLLITYNNKLSDEPYLGYNEITIFKELYLSLLKVVQKSSKKIKLIVKIHPRENIKYYQRIMVDIDNTKIKVVFDMKSNPQELIRISNMVCGMSSMLLIESVLLDKPTVSIQIGLKRKNPFILDQMNLANSILTQNELYNKIESIIINNQKHTKIKMDLINNPIEKVSKYIKDYIC
jgi:hypothetical protein